MIVESIRKKKGRRNEPDIISLSKGIVLGGYALMGVNIWYLIIHHEPPHLLLCPLFTWLWPHWLPWDALNAPGTLLLEGLCILQSLYLEFSLLRSTRPTASPPPSLCSETTLSRRATPMTHPSPHPSSSPLLLLFSMTCVTFKDTMGFTYLLFVGPLLLKHMLQEVRDLGLSGSLMDTRAVNIG